ncbi:MAG: DJ-1/PfpI family protein [Anaerolineales bacterium]|nr:DJ-1/PfpI family protein [Anaerolineales bacterium]
MTKENSTTKQNVAILLYDGVELLDFAGPGEVFERAGNGDAFNVYTVAATTDPILSQGFVRIIPEFSVSDSPPPDILVVPGGVRYSTLENQALLDWVKDAAGSASVNFSVCTGVFLLAKAGLLEDKAATTHHGSIDKLAEFSPGTQVQANARYIDNQGLVTAAGVSAGIDASLYVVSQLLGKNAAREVAYYMEYFWDPDDVTNDIETILTAN